MGQVFKRLQEYEGEPSQPLQNLRRNGKPLVPSRFHDLNDLPPELALLVLSHLNATDLCLAACVWDNLGNDDFLWQGLCRSQWGYSTAYRRKHEPGFCFRKLYLQLDEATLTFNADPEMGLEYMLKHNLVEEAPLDLAKFLHFARHIDREKQREFLSTRHDVLNHLVELQNFENQFLPNALRKFFNETRPPNDRGSYLHELVEKFSERFITCNPRLGFSRDTVYVVCFSLIMLSVDLSSPHVKNKMSKREFIRNTRNAAEGVNDDFAGHLYDNVYLIGHVAPRA